ncbi:MAG: hypothetical protein II752_02685 [Muribaculaceae bacterium]|nr:hypothetical protein [Muribaculaceae bacterium]
MTAEADCVRQNHFAVWRRAMLKVKLRLLSIFSSQSSPLSGEMSGEIRLHLNKIKVNFAFVFGLH